MRRNNRRPFNEEIETRKIVIISFSVLAIAVVAFIITFILYRNYLNGKTEIAKLNTSITDLGKSNEQISSQASSSIGKTVNEMQEENVIANEIKNEEVNEINTEKIAINTSNMQKEESKQEEVKQTVVPKTETQKEEKVPDPTFIKPVEGEIMAEFAKDTLLYSNTLQEWVTHNGIDIKADKTTIVKASAEGTVKSIKNDPRYGITVVIEHVNGFSTIYSNLLTAEFIQEGEKVKQGQTIGTVGNTATFEIADDFHLHFEMQKDGEYINPSIHLK